MGLIILVLLAAAVVTLLMVAASKPNTFRIERSASVAAAPEAVHAQIVDFHKWVDWSPWERMDPSMERHYSGAEQGIGAIYSWAGSGKAGQGRMEISEATAAKILIRLEFIKPFKATNTAEFTLEPQGDDTLVTWAMYGPRPFVSKIMGTLFNMDDLVGKDFEAGLSNLKVLVEPSAEYEAGASEKGATP